MTFMIYALFDPRTETPCYIGKTKNPRNRWQEHISTARKESNRSAVAGWIRELLAAGLEPEMVCLETVETGWQEVECRWIDALRSRGYTLHNTRPGGINSGAPPSPALPPLRWWSLTDGFTSPPT